MDIKIPLVDKKKSKNKVKKINKKADSFIEKFLDLYRT